MAFGSFGRGESEVEAQKREWALIRYHHKELSRIWTTTVALS